MKKLFLVLLAAGLFAACGTKKEEVKDEAIDSTAIEAIVDTPEVEPMAEAVETATTAPKTNVEKPKTETKAEEVKATITEEAKEAIQKAVPPAKEEPAKPATPNKPRR